MARLDETRRVKRLLDIAWRIAVAPGEWPRKRLAGLYEVSERQITSDLTVLRQGLHWQVRRGLTGYSFDPLPTLPGVQYTLPEALALLLAVRASAALPGVVSGDLAAAVARLTSLLPPAVQALAALPAAPLSPREHALRVLQLALAQRQRVRMTYETASRGGAVTEREFDPYAIVPYGRSWHVIGHCHLRGAVRDFKIDRIAAVQPVTGMYDVPADFDAARFLGAGWGLMREPDAPVEDVELRFSALAGRWVREERWHATQAITELADGGVRFCVQIPVTSEFRHWVFHYGSLVEVVSPASLREWVRTEAARVWQRYAAEGEQNDPACDGTVGVDSLGQNTPHG